jgi:hypothetical protein
MKTMRFLSFLCVSMAMFALPAAAQTPDGTTPANEDVCDNLADATPGLYGLCVAFCEAQDCEATLDPATGEVTLEPSCRPSSATLLENYFKKAGPADPQVPPCVKVPCPCWSESEIDDIGGFESGGFSSDNCLAGPSFTGIFGTARDGRGAELAYALDDRANGLMCIMSETSPPTVRERTVNAVEYQRCRESIIDECEARGITPFATR